MSKVSPAHEHGPSTRVSKMTPVFMGHADGPVKFNTAVNGASTGHRVHVLTVM